MNLRNLVNVEVKEPEKARSTCVGCAAHHTEKFCQDLPVIYAEADQAQRNRPEVGQAVR